MPDRGNNDLIDRKALLLDLSQSREDGTFEFSEEQAEAADKIVRYIFSRIMAQPAVPGLPRVLTLEEVKDSIGEAIYFESRGTYMGKVVFPILPALFTPHGLMRYVHPQSSHYSELGLHDYGKVWRCWSARPTEEQRKAAPWPC